MINKFADLHNFNLACLVAVAASRSTLWAEGNGMGLTSWFLQSSADRRTPSEREWYNPIFTNHIHNKYTSERPRRNELDCLLAK